MQQLLDSIHRVREAKIFGFDQTLVVALVSAYVRGLSEHVPQDLNPVVRRHQMVSICLYCSQQQGCSKTDDTLFFHPRVIYHAEKDRTRVVNAVIPRWRYVVKWQHFSMWLEIECDVDDCSKHQVEFSCSLKGKKQRKVVITNYNGRKIK